MENNSSNLTVSKEFNCSKDALYDAWTQPEQLKQWWKPVGNTLTDVVNDIKDGGEVKYMFKDNLLTIDGKYEKVEDHSLLEYTWNWHLKAEHAEGAAYKLSVRFDGDNNSSSITVTQNGFQSEESVQPHRQGWEQGLQQLQDYLSGKNSSDNSASGTNNNESREEEAEEKYMPPVTGYNETEEQAKVGGA
jgi:uncharacterized protein YndB with AHSA1/START domain